MWKKIDGFEFGGDKSKKIWRYLDIKKLESLFKKKALYFASAEELHDKYEGAISDSEFKKMFDYDFEKINDVELETLKNAYRHQRVGGYHSFKQLREFAKISCWHLNQHESAAMWKLYAGEKKGIAIQSTVENLCASFLEYKIKPAYGNEDIWVGKVKYIDFSKDEMANSMLSRFFYKRISFSHECELRAVVSLRMAAEYGVSTPVKGILVPVNTEKLIQKIYISPEIADAGFIEEVKALIRAYNYSFPVIHSDLSKDPVY